MIIIILAVLWVVFGLIFMAMESRWQISAYVNAIDITNEFHETYKERVIKKKEEIIDKQKISSILMFLLWGIFLFVVAISLLLLLLTKTWYFFYNGFRLYPPSLRN